MISPSYCTTINWAEVQHVGGFDPVVMFWNFVHLALALLPVIVTLLIVAFLLYLVPPPFIPYYWRERPPR